MSIPTVSAIKQALLAALSAMTCAGHARS